MLNKINDPNVRAYVVWVPMLEMDEAAAVAEATKFLPDRRVRHFWDAKGTLKEAYASVLQLGEGQTAWDVYFAYGRDAEWKAERPPDPAYWMHQLSQLGQERRLDPTQFAAEVNKLLSPGVK
ncbi:MAG: hypothetical protein ACJ754_17100 [Pyrinomonadaceae bacterium]